MRKSFRVAIIVVVVLIVGAGVAAAFVAHYVSTQLDKALPEYAGTVELKGLSAETHVYRDSYGVPHIFANNMNDAVRALGYIHASERLFQMESQRRAGQGRLSEVLGSDMLGVDKFVRTLGLYHLAESSYAAMPPDAKAFFQAYADGVNAWISTHPENLPPEFMIIGFKPEPWQPADSIVWGKLMGLQLSNNYKLELLRAKLSKTLNNEQMARLFPLPPGTAPVTIAPHSLIPVAAPAAPAAAPATAPVKTPAKKKSENQMPDANTQLGAITGLDHGASNEWAIAGSRTTSGKPILANDPHLGIEAPILWYLARIVTPDFSIKGGTVPGLPVFLLGQNDHIAWGFTTTDSDVQDLFIETVDPQNADNYMTPQGSKPFAVRKEVIHVKHGLDVTLNVRTTRHGPVMSDIDDEMADAAGTGKVLALAFTGLSDKDMTSESLMRLNRATNWKEFLDALKLYQTPPQNAAYADTAGNIGYFNPGVVPVRKTGVGTMPVDGASGKYDWIGTVPFPYLPQAYNPAAGFVFNANNAVVALGSVYYMGVDWEEPYRAERLQEFFDTTKQFSLATSADMQADITSLVAKQLLPYLLSITPSGPKATDAIALLRSWDGTMDKDRPEPLIFDAWLHEMHEMMLVDKAGDPLAERGPYAATSIASIFGSNDSEWCGKSLAKPASDCKQLISDALDAALGMLSHREHGGMNVWRWGDEHITVLKNKFYSHIPFLASMSDLSLPSSGDFYTLDRGGSFKFDPDHPFVRTHAGGYRGIYDLADPSRSRFMIATGESGHIKSPHYGDLTPFWNDVKSFTLTGSADDLKAQGAEELVFQPGR